MVNFCYLFVTCTVYAFVTHFVMAYVRSETNFSTRIEFSGTLQISLQGSTPRIHSNTPLHDFNPRLQSMTPLHKIHSAIYLPVKWHKKHANMLNGRGRKWANGQNIHDSENKIDPPPPPGVHLSLPWDYIHVYDHNSQTSLLV